MNSSARIEEQQMLAIVDWTDEIQNALSRRIRRGFLPSNCRTRGRLTVHQSVGERVDSVEDDDTCSKILVRLGHSALARIETAFSGSNCERKVFAIKSRWHTGSEERSHRLGCD